MLCEALYRRLPELEFAVPSGGMALWAQVKGINVDGWAKRGMAAGVAFQPGRRYAIDGRFRPSVRLGFAACDEGELREAVRRMASAR